MCKGVTAIFFPTVLSCAWAGIATVFIVAGEVFLYPSELIFRTEALIAGVFCTCGV